MRHQLDFDSVRKLALALPGVEEGTAYGTQAVKIKGDLLACMAVNQSAEPQTLALRVSFEDRDELIANAPETYYTTPHYQNYPCVLVRLSRIDEGTARDLVRMGWKFVSAKARKKPAHRKEPHAARKA